MVNFCYNRITEDLDLRADYNNSLKDLETIREFHQSLPGYWPTSLIRLPALAEKFGIKDILIKDESSRMNLKAFKVLGASYAIYRLLKQKYEQKTGVKFSINQFFEKETKTVIGEITFCTATDGNHGRAVAWTAKQLGQKAVIYMPADSVKARIENIQNENGKVVLVDGSYDLAVKQAALDAEQNGWTVISDTSYQGYENIPKDIMAGYLTIFDEINDALAPDYLNKNDFVIVQCGVGALAAAAGVYYNGFRGEKPTLICVEPIEADCMLESILRGDGSIRSSQGSLETIMVGLNCGTPSSVAFPIIQDSFGLFLAIEDNYCEKAMRIFYNPIKNDSRIIAGESGAAGLAGLLVIMSPEYQGLREKLQLNENSRVLLINTEGDTDPAGFEKIINRQSAN